MIGSAGWLFLVLCLVAGTCAQYFEIQDDSARILFGKTSDVVLQRTGVQQLTCTADLWFSTVQPFSTISLNVSGTLEATRNTGVTAMQGATFSSTARVYIPQTFTAMAAFGNSGTSAITTVTATSLTVSSPSRLGVNGLVSVNGNVVMSGTLALITGSVLLLGLGANTASLTIINGGVLSTQSLLTVSGAFTAPATSVTTIGTGGSVSVTSTVTPGGPGQPSVGAIRVRGGAAIQKTVTHAIAGGLYLPNLLGGTQTKLNFYEEYTAASVLFTVTSGTTFSPTMRITRIGSLVTISIPRQSWTETGSNFPHTSATTAVGIIPTRFCIPSGAVLKVSCDVWDGAQHKVGYVQFSSNGQISITSSYDAIEVPGTGFGSPGAVAQWSGVAVSWVLDI